MLNEILRRISLDDEEAFVGAGEIVRAVRLGSAADESEPYSNYVRDNALTPSDVLPIRDALIEHLRSRGAYAHSGAVMALKEFHDPALVSVLKEHLGQVLGELLRLNAGFASSIAALEACGEPITSGSWGLTTVENNIQAAQAYLRLHGNNISW